jgi:hypothetical protein
MRDPEALGDELMTVDVLEQWIVRWLYESWVNTPLERLRWDELLVDSVEGKTPLERVSYLTEEMGYPITMPPPRHQLMAALFEHDRCRLSAKTGITLKHGYAQQRAKSSCNQDKSNTNPRPMVPSTRIERDGWQPGFTGGLCHHYLITTFA